MTAKFVDEYMTVQHPNFLLAGCLVAVSVVGAIWLSRESLHGSRTNAVLPFWVPLETAASVALLQSKSVIASILYSGSCLPGCIQF